MSDIPISVVITCFNQGRFAERAIKSIALQRYPKDLIQLIVVDDGSSDDSVPLIEESMESYTRIKDQTLVTKENGGTASARNAGIKNAKHNIIAFLDVDDEYLPDKLGKSIEYMLEYDGVTIVYSDYIEVFEDGIKKRVFKPPFDRERLFRSCIVSTNSVVHKQVFDKIGLFDENIKKVEDYDLWLRASAISMIRHIPEPLFVYYNHGQNKTATSDMNYWQHEEKIIKERAARGEYQLAS